ncbi:MAG: hypothetical protein MUD04_08615 [Cyanobium sp. Prado107]|jgi:hypothetical protein|nr:hypothetical protein [Cyanobium sp. Prado107]
MTNPEALQMLRIACTDLKAARALQDDDIDEASWDEASWGFHLQQVVERRSRPGCSTSATILP